MLLLENLSNKKYLTNIIFLIFGSFCFSLMTVCVKKINIRIPIYELVFFRSIFSLFITSLIINKKRINPWGINKSLLLLRGILGTIALICIFYSIRSMPLSIATVIQYTYPIFISIFAGIIIKERISTKIYTALIFGWLGILIILNPFNVLATGLNIKNIDIIIAILGSISTSLAYITVKKLSSTEDIFVIIKYFPLVSFICLSPIVLMNWVTPTLYDLGWIIGIGAFTQAGQTFLTLGIKNLKASRAATINYMQVLFAAIWGINIFGEEISINFIIGSSLVLLGTIISTSKFHKKI